MLFRPEAIVHERGEVLSRVQSGEMDLAEAGHKLLSLDPADGLAYLMLGEAQIDAGNLEAAESWLWKGLENRPLDAGPYLTLVNVRRQRHTDDPIARSLLEMAFWKLGAADEIPAPVAEAFRKELAQDGSLDFKEPALYEALAMTLQKQGGTEAPEVAECLLPYRMLAEFQRKAPRVVDAELLSEIQEHADRCAPLWHAALREWARPGSHANEKCAQLVVAVLGETGSSDLIPDLLELTAWDEPVMFVHANWAIWRIGRRFPDATIKALRAATPRAPVQLRCGFAEHLALLPENPEIRPALLDLLEGFSEFAGQDDAPYLLTAVAATLARSGHDEDVKTVMGCYLDALPTGGREWVEKTLNSEEGFIPRLVREEIPDLSIEDVCIERMLMDDEEDEEEEEAAPPVRPARNDPCWCGSGKKYKKCHLAADEESDRKRAGEESANSAEPQRPADPLAQKLFTDVLESVTDWLNRADFREATRRYFGKEPELVDREAENSAGFFEWIVYDFRAPSSGRTGVEEYLRRRGGRLTARERGMLEAWRKARFGLFEVERVEEGAGVELHDVCSGDRVFVHDVSSSRALARWDCILTRVEEFEGRWTLGFHAWSVPRPTLPLLLEHIEQGRKAANQSAAEYVRANSHRLYRVVEELNRGQRENLRIVNAEGDPLEFCAAVYEIRDEAAVLEALRAEPEFQEDAANAGAPDVRGFAWLENRAGDSRRSYGHLEIRHGRLRLECNSRRRLETGRKLIESRAGSWLRHMGDSFESLEAAKRRAGAEAAKPPKSSIPPEVERQVILNWKQQHYANWPDEPLPALHGATPREAAKTAEGRARLEELIRLMENGEERLRKKGGAAYDFTPIRKSLGME